VLDLHCINARQAITNADAIRMGLVELFICSREFSVVVQFEF